jgi:hypothetical protein
MHTEQLIGTESAGNQIETDSAAVRRRWQFSLRGLLTTAMFISVCAAMGTTFLTLHFAVFATVLVLELLYWLTPARARRELCLIIALMWAMLGTSVLVSGVKWAYVLTANNEGREARANVLFSLAVAAVLYWLAWRHWRRSSTYGRENL